MAESIIISKNSLFGVSLNKLSSKYKYKEKPIILEICHRYMQEKLTEMIGVEKTPTSPPPVAKVGGPPKLSASGRAVPPVPPRKSLPTSTTTTANTSSTNLAIPSTGSAILARGTIANISSTNLANSQNEITEVINQCRDFFKLAVVPGKNKETVEQWVQTFAKSSSHQGVSNESQVQNLVTDLGNNMNLESALLIVYIFLELVPSKLMADIQNDLVATGAKVQPIMIVLNALESHERAVLQVYIKTLHLFSRYYQSLTLRLMTKDFGNKSVNDHQIVKIIADKFSEIFFNNAAQNQILKKVLAVMVNEYGSIFQEPPLLEPKLIPGEEVQFGPVHYVKLQIFDSEGEGSTNSTNSSVASNQQNVNPKLRCVTLWVSNFRVIYNLWVQESKDKYEDYGIPLSSIQTIKKSGRYIKVTTKNFKMINVGFTHKTDESLFISVSEKLAFHKPIKSIFSFHNKEETDGASAGSGKSKSSKTPSTILTKESYWNLLGLEYQRFGVTLTSTKDSKSPQQSSNQSLWRLSQVNNRLDVCQSYPNTLIVPKGIQDSQLKEFAHFRVSKRFPVISWINTAKPNVFLSISHPPRIDYLTVTSNVFGSDDEDEDQDSKYDHLLISELSKTTGDSQPLAVFDTGVQPRNPYDSFYTICKFHYLDMPSHEVNKQSYQKLLDLCLSSGFVSSNRAKWTQMVEATGWVDTVKNTLRNAVKIVDTMILGRPAIIQSSEGHDFDEILLSSLVQLFMDPFYRTIKGFQRLVQKEWCEFGYPFGRHFSSQDRGNLPVTFVLFMDCVSQLLYQYPIDFEFNEKTVGFITDEVFNGRFGNFIAKSLKDFEQMSVQNNSISIWSFMNNSKKPTAYLNPNYKDYSKSNLPVKVFNVEQVHFWSYFFSRWVSIDSRISTSKSISLQLSLQNDLTLSSMAMFDLPSALFKPHLAKIEQIKKFQLTDNYLLTLPKTLLLFKNLKELILDHNLISVISSSFYQLFFDSVKSLELLSLGQNQITTIPNEISLGGSLIKLNFQGNRVETISPHIVKLERLTSLNLSSNGLQVFPLQITHVQTLSELDLSTNEIKNIPTHISTLTNLKSLLLFDNKIKKLPNTLSSLKNLKILNLIQNKLKIIDSICLLSNLEELYLDFNKISEIPDDIQLMSNLTLLSLPNNRIQSLPEELMLLSQLKSLNLAQNQITWLPPTICQLEKLESLYIQNNQIDSIPQSIGMLNNLAILDIEGNNLNKKLAKELGAGGIKELLAQMKEFIETIQPYGKSKIYILGNNHVKNNKILTNLLFSKEKRSQKSLSSQVTTPLNTDSSVPGIDIDNILIEYANPANNTSSIIELNCWEFQNNFLGNIYQPLFFTEKSIYLVQFVFNPTEEGGSATLNYWLDQICHRFNNNVKIFAVGFISSEVSNQLTDSSFSQWVSSWKSCNKASVFVSRQIEFTFISSSTADDDLETLKQKILESLPKKTMANEMVPAPYSLLEKSIIEKRSNNNMNFISKDDLTELATIFNIRSKPKIGNVLKYLENISNILQFPSDNQCGNLIVTNPLWFFQQIQLLHNSSTNKTSPYLVRKVDIPASIQSVLPALEKYCVISYAEPLGSLPIPLESPLLLSSENVIVNNLFDSNTSFDFLDDLVLHQPPSDVFIERYLEFKYSIPASLYLEFKFKLYQICKLEFENTIEKKSLFISIQDHLGEENNQLIRLYLQQVDSSTLKLIFFGSEEKMAIINDFQSKCLEILRQLLLSKFSFNSFEILLPCIHANQTGALAKKTQLTREKRHFFRLEYCELAFLLGYTSVKCPHTAMDVNLSTIAPDVTMVHFPLILQESQVKFDKELGRGGFGVVYKGKVKEKDVAIKKLIIDNTRYSSSDSQMISINQINPDDEMDLIKAYRDFQREAYSLHQFSKCKNILSFDGVILNPPCLVTEFVSKGDLSSYIKKLNSPMPIQHAIRIAQDVAAGMCEIHSKMPPLHHNDLKPPNILMAQLPEPVNPTGAGSSNIAAVTQFNNKLPVAIIADLGTVFDSINSRLLGRIVDNPIYLAPEVLKGQWYDHISDVYSFGVILYEMISKTGGYYSEITFFSGIEDTVLKGKRPPLPTIDNSDPVVATNYLNLIQQCWHQDPSQRPNFKTIQNILSSMNTPNIVNSPVSLPTSPSLKLGSSGSAANSPSSRSPSLVGANSGWTTASNNSSPTLSGSQQKISKPFLKSHAL